MHSLGQPTLDLVFDAFPLDNLLTLVLSQLLLELVEVSPDFNQVFSFVSFPPVRLLYLDFSSAVTVSKRTLKIYLLWKGKFMVVWVFEKEPHALHMFELPVVNLDSLVF